MTAPATRPDGHTGRAVAGLVQTLPPTAKSPQARKKGEKVNSDETSELTFVDATASTPEPVKSAQQRGRMSRTKGQSGEREVAAILGKLTGHDVRRRVRQHAGDSDLDGLVGWGVEIKRHATTPAAKLACWWAQTVDQARVRGELPVLFYRGDREQWRCCWPAGLHAGARQTVSADFNDCLTGTPMTWWLMCKHMTSSLHQ